MKPEHLKRYSYLLCRSKDVSHRLKRLYFLDEPVVIFRDSTGVCRAYLDHCPHRGVPLSSGRLVENQIECAYHGWRFDVEEGLCQHIPALNQSWPFCLKKVFLLESNGFVFARFFESVDPACHLPPPDSCDEFYWGAQLSGTLLDSIENFLDATHTPYVHAHLIRSAQKPQRVQAELIRSGSKIQIIYTGEQKQNGWISRFFERERSHSEAIFHMPSTAEITYYHAQGLTLKIRVYLTPVNGSQNQAHVFFYIPKGKIPGWIKYAIFYPFFYWAFKQDKSILEKQLQNHRDMKLPFHPIYCQSDLIRAHLRDFMLNQNFSKNLCEKTEIFV